jgi:hypothetical protein
VTSPLCPSVLVSWDGSGAFTGPYDDVTHDVAAEPGLTIDEGRDGAQALSPPKIGSGSFELDNEDGTYSQNRADSPIYQRVLPGRPVGFSAPYGVTDTYDAATPYDEPDPYDGRATWALGRHVVDAISQTTDWGKRRVRLDTIGAEVVLTDAVVSVPVQTAIRTDEAVTLLLDAVGWPVGRRAVSIGDTTLLYWWCDERRPWDALLELLAAEGPGTMYVDRDGTFRWENRNYRTTQARSAATNATYRAVTSSPNGLSFTRLTYDPGYKSIYNRATYTCRRRAPGTPGTQVWSYGQSLTLAPGQSVTLIARPTNPFLAAIAPAVGTDYTVTAGSATVTLASATGVVAFIVVAAGAGAATVAGPTASPAIGLQLRATPLAVQSETTVQNGVDASASIATYSAIPGAAIPITLAVAGWAEIDPAMATAVCDAWVSAYKDPRPNVTLAIRNADDAHVAQIVTRRVSDRVTVEEPNTGLATDFWINGMELRFFGGGGPPSVEMVLRAEQCNNLGGAVWDLSVWDAAAALWGI